MIQWFLMGRPGGLFISPNTVKAQLFSWWERNFQFSAKNQMQNNRWKHFSVVYESKQLLFIYNYSGSFGIIFVVSPLGDFLAFMLLLSVVGQRTKNQQRHGGIMVASFHFHFTCVSVFFFLMVVSSAVSHVLFCSSPAYFPFTPIL